MYARPDPAGRSQHIQFVESLRRAKTLVDEAGDNAASGVLAGWTDEAERRAWFLFEASRTG